MKKVLLTLLCIFASYGLVAQPTLELLSETYLPYWNGMSDIWGYVDPQGNEYALATTVTGVSILDINDPTDPEEVDYIEGELNIWRDAKTWGTYAYVVSEAEQGLLIYDLSELPDDVTVFNWEGGIYQDTLVSFTTAHNIFIDENGIGYVCGANYSMKGVIMLDIAGNPTNPEVIGLWDDRYVHDLYVRDDVMWTSDVEDGLASIVDIADKNNPTVLNTIETPLAKTHNTWLDDTGNYLFVTEEVTGGSIIVYDVSNVYNPFPVFQFIHPSEAIPHNAFVKGDKLYASYYTAGVLVFDISDPENMEVIATYDTSPLVGTGTNGCWGVYPYLPSGNILATDRGEGLFIFAGESITNAQTAQVDLKVYLEGAYNSNEGKMNAALQDLIPLQQPYHVAPFNYEGTETLSSIPANMVDWVLVEAREGTPNVTGERATITVETQAAILLDNGDIVSADGTTEGVKFENLAFGTDYYFCIRHRNHLDILTAESLTASASMTYDLTTEVASAFGTNQLKSTEDGKAVMHTGDFVKDGVIQLTDFDFWFENPANLDAYESTDANLDGVIQVTDFDAWLKNKAKLGTVEIDF